MDQRIFVDMDGVLAEFKQVDTMESLYEKGYFAELKPIEPVVTAIRELTRTKKAAVYILSAYLSDSNYALSEKNEWLDKNLPEIRSSARLFVPCGMSKVEWLEDNGYVIDKSDVLLDDYSHNLHEWQKYGTGIKLLNGINGTKGTWKGRCISIEDEDLQDTLLFGISGVKKARQEEIKLETDELEV